MELFTGGLALCKQAGSLTHVNCATLLMVYLAPFSRGSVTISSKEGICIDLGLLSDKRDLECIEKGLRLSFDIANDPIYRDSCVKRWILPAEDMDQLNLEEYIKENIETIHHYAGTCKVSVIRKARGQTINNLHLRWGQKKIAWQLSMNT